MNWRPGDVFTLIASYKTRRITLVSGAATTGPFNQLIQGFHQTETPWRQADCLTNFGYGERVPLIAFITCCSKCLIRKPSIQQSYCQNGCVIKTRCASPFRKRLWCPTGIEHRSYSLTSATGCAPKSGRASQASTRCAASSGGASRPSLLSRAKLSRSGKAAASAPRN